MRMMNAQSGSRVSITVDGVSSVSSVVSGSRIATFTVLREVLLEEREPIHHEREQLVRLDLLEAPPAGSRGSTRGCTTRAGRGASP